MKSGILQLPHQRRPLALNSYEAFRACDDQELPSNELFARCGGTRIFQRRCRWPPARRPPRYSGCCGLRFSSLTRSRLTPVLTSGCRSRNHPVAAFSTRRSKSLRYASSRSRSRSGLVADLTENSFLSSCHLLLLLIGSKLTHSELRPRGPKSLALGSARQRTRSRKCPILR